MAKVIKRNAKEILKQAFAHKNGGINKTPPQVDQAKKATAVFAELDKEPTSEPIAVAPVNLDPVNLDDDLPSEIKEELPPVNLDDDLPSEIVEELLPVNLDDDFPHLNHDDEGLEAPGISYVDDLLQAATKESVFFDDEEPALGYGSNTDAPPELDHDHIEIIHDDEDKYYEKNAESLSLLDKVKADKDAKKREHQKNLKQLEAITSEQNELEEIMRQQLLKQQKEEAEKLNEGIQRIRTRHRNFLNLLRTLHSLEPDAIVADNLINIAQEFKQSQTITLQSYLLINRNIHKHKIKYDLNEIRVFLSEDLLDINTPPLDFDYYYLWESDLDQKITPYMWDKHKMMVFEQANYVCELCGGVGEHNPVELYPHWKLFDNSRMQILHSFLALCPKCVDAKNHKQLKDRGLKMRYESAREHIKTVNNWDDRQVENALLEADDAYKRRVDEKAEPERFKKWKLNVSILETLFNIKIQDPDFNQRSHIKSVHQNIFEHHVNYLFGKIESDRMIKTGKTKFISIKLNAEPMKR
jgi:transcription initiation factor TFIIIB Brf1 subunit/transcription initiation factor TFIIB